MVEGKFFRSYLGGVKNFKEYVYVIICLINFFLSSLIEFDWRVFVFWVGYRILVLEILNLVLETLKLFGIEDEEFFCVGNFFFNFLFM